MSVTDPSPTPAKDYRLQATTQLPVAMHLKFESLPAHHFVT